MLSTSLALGVCPFMVMLLRTTSAKETIYAHTYGLFGCSHSTENFQNNGIYAGVATINRAPTLLVMQAGLTRFSYCLFAVSGCRNTTTNRQQEGFLRFGTHVPPNLHYKTTSILPAHEPEYYVSLVGVSLGARRLG